MKKITTIDVEKENIGALFAPPREQGSAEWRTFNIIRHDAPDAYPLTPPKKKDGRGKIIFYPRLRRAH